MPNQDVAFAGVGHWAWQFTEVVVRHIKQTLLRVLAAALFVVSSAGIMQADGYVLYDRDSFNFVSADGRVRAYGTMGWFKGARRLQPDIWRGQFEQGAWVQLQTNGCMHIKVTYALLTGSASWPPSLSGQSVTDGFWVICGQKGKWVNLQGQGYASSALYAATLSIGFSQNIYMPRANVANHKMTPGMR
jgi:hypothetical protein